MPSGMTDSPHSSIGKLIRDNVFQRRPPYQRNYRWTDEKVSQLFDDIDAAIQRKDERYFLGLMVFMKSDGGNGLTVLDGQQRLTTVFLFLAALPKLDEPIRRASGGRTKAERRVHRKSKICIQVKQACLPEWFSIQPTISGLSTFVVRPRPVADLQSELDKMKKHDRSRRLLEAAVYCHSRIAALAEGMDYLACAARLSRIVNFLNESAPVV